MKKSPENQVSTRRTLLRFAAICFPIALVLIFSELLFFAGNLDSVWKILDRIFWYSFLPMIVGFSYIRREAGEYPRPFVRIKTLRNVWLFGISISLALACLGYLLLRTESATPIFFLFYIPGFFFGLVLGAFSSGTLKKRILDATIAYDRPIIDVQLGNYWTDWLAFVLIFYASISLSKALFQSDILWVSAHLGLLLGSSVCGLIWTLVYERRNTIRVRIDFPCPERHNAESAA